MLLLLAGGQTATLPLAVEADTTFLPSQNATLTLAAEADTTLAAGQNAILTLITQADTTLVGNGSAILALSAQADTTLLSGQNATLTLSAQTNTTLTVVQGQIIAFALTAQADTTIALSQNAIMPLAVQADSTLASGQIAVLVLVAQTNTTLLANITTSFMVATQADTTLSGVRGQNANLIFGVQVGTGIITGQNAFLILAVQASTTLIARKTAIMALAVQIATTLSASRGSATIFRRQADRSDIGLYSNSRGVANRSVNHVPPPVQHPQDFAMQTLAYSHDESLYIWGEYTMFILRWTVRDFEQGYVDRCSFCYLAYGEISEAYGQSSQAKCPECFGTTFTGGFRAKVFRPALWQPVTDRDNDQGRRGTEVTAITNLQTVSDIILRHGDVACRADGHRFRIEEPDSDIPHTGFADGSVRPEWPGMVATRVVLEDESSAWYMVPPTAAEMELILRVPGARTPVDMTAYEIIRGPLW